MSSIASRPPGLDLRSHRPNLPPDDQPGNDSEAIETKVIQHHSRMIRSAAALEVFGDAMARQLAQGLACLRDGDGDAAANEVDAVGGIKYIQGSTVGALRGARAGAARCGQWRR